MLAETIKFFFNPGSVATPR